MRLSRSQLEDALAALEGATADDLESESLEIKGRPDGPDELSKWAVEAAVCFANSQGGTLLVGVKDRVRGRSEAIRGIGDISTTNLRRRIYAGTEPHILVEVEEWNVPEGRVLAVHVPRGLPPHTTSGGVGKIRVGKSCEPLTGSLLVQLASSRGELDPSAHVLQGATLDELDPAALAEARRLVRGQPRLSQLADAKDVDLLEGLGLLSDGELRRAALLLFGSRSALQRHLPQHEVTLVRYPRSDRYDRRLELRGAIVLELSEIESFLDASIKTRTLTRAGFAQLELPGLTWEVAREAVLNALSHRDYFLHEGTLISVYPDRVTVANPGGFIGGITPENVLRHPPAHRNELLARSLQQLGLVNRVGLGVDRIYEGLLRLGAPAPTYSADEASVVLSLPQGGSDQFAAWVAERERSGARLGLNDLLILRRLTQVGSIDRWAAARVLQVNEAEAAEHLSVMRGDGLLVSRGRGRTASYALHRPLSEALRGRDATDADRPLETEGVRLRLLELLDERGRLTNAEIRAFSGYTRRQVLALEKALEADGLVELRGYGRGAHIVPAEKQG